MATMASVFPWLLRSASRSVAARRASASIFCGSADTAIPPPPHGWQIERCARTARGDLDARRGMCGGGEQGGSVGRPARSPRTLSNGQGRAAPRNGKE
jgi:hypothetical protein